MATNLFQPEIEITTISFELNNGTERNLDILRLDKIHPVVTGNKWYKLKYNIEAAKALGAQSLLSFGGAYSNHLHALAYAGYLLNIKTIAYVRGEETTNPTLADCKAWGMELFFISREDYRKKTERAFLDTLVKRHPHAFIIPEGGDNDLGQKGCEEIVTKLQMEQYATICVSIGTGTTFKGIRKSYTGNMKGFCALKNGKYLEANLLNLNAEQSAIYYDEYFGGFGKINNELIEFVLDFEAKYQITLDLIYNAKLFFSLKELLINAEFAKEKILIIHTGGAQGNRSQVELI